MRCRSCPAALAEAGVPGASNVASERARTWGTTMDEDKESVRARPWAGGASMAIPCSSSSERDARCERSEERRVRLETRGMSYPAGSTWLMSVKWSWGGRPWSARSRTMCTVPSSPYVRSATRR